MRVPELVQGIDGAEHLADVEAGVWRLEKPGVDQQRTEVTTGDEFHRQIEALRVLERVQELDQPLGPGGGQDVTFCEHMVGSLELHEQFLVQDLEGADLFGVLFAGQVHLSVATLADLGDHFEVFVLWFEASFAQDVCLAGEVALPLVVDGRGVHEMSSSLFFQVVDDLSCAFSSADDVVEHVAVVVEEVHLAYGYETLGLGLGGFLVEVLWEFFRGLGDVWRRGVDVHHHGGGRFDDGSRGRGRLSGAGRGGRWVQDDFAMGISHAMGIAHGIDIAQSRV